MINVSVAYASSSNLQVVIELSVDIGCTVQQAIKQSGLLQQFPEIDLQHNSIGIYSRKVTLDYELSPNDRVEIYRPLQIDPRQARMSRVKAERSKN